MLLVLIVVLVLLLVVIPVAGLALWALLGVAVVGLFVGGIARLVLPGRQNVGVLATILLGWIGSLIGGFVGYRLLHVHKLPTLLIEIAVAAVLVALYSRSADQRNSAWTSLPRR